MYVSPCNRECPSVHFGKCIYCVSSLSLSLLPRFVRVSLVYIVTRGWCWSLSYFHQQPFPFHVPTPPLDCTSATNHLLRRSSASLVHRQLAIATLVANSPTLLCFEATSNKTTAYSFFVHWVFTILPLKTTHHHRHHHHPQSKFSCLLIPEQSVPLCSYRRCLLIVCQRRRRRRRSNKKRAKVTIINNARQLTYSNSFGWAPHTYACLLARRGTCYQQVPPPPPTSKLSNICVCSCRLCSRPTIQPRPSVSDQ